MFIVILLWVFGVAFGSVGVVIAASNIITYKQFGMFDRKFLKLSKAGQHVMKAFAELDSEYRPMSMEQMYNSLLALEVKHGRAEVDQVFTHRYRTFEGGWRSTFAWEKASGHVAKDYKHIHRDIEDLKRALEERKHALAVSSKETDLQALSDAAEAMRAEAGIVRHVTGELL